MSWPGYGRLVTMSDTVFALLVALTPVWGLTIMGAGALCFRWRKKRAKRRLDEMFEADRQWWEDQFSGPKK